MASVLNLINAATDHKKAELSTGRARAISFESSLDRSLEADCVRYDAVSEDHGSPVAAVLVLSEHGYACVHPELDAFIVVSYSERLPEGEEFLPLEMEGEAFLKSLEFTRCRSFREGRMPLAERYISYLAGGDTSLVMDPSDGVQAETCFKRALAIAEQLGGPEHPEVAYSLDRLASIYRTQRRGEEAAKLEARAQTIRAKTNQNEDDERPEMQRVAPDL